MTEPRDVVAEVLTVHYFADGGNEPDDDEDGRFSFTVCRCGAYFEAESYVEAIAALRAHQADAVLAALDLPALLAEAHAEALNEAADAWQQGQWADAPRRNDRVQERLANAQHVTDWLRQRSKDVRGE